MPLAGPYQITDRGNEVSVLSPYLEYGPLHKVIQVCASFPFFTTCEVTDSCLSIVSALLLRRPMITQCITASILFGAGDVVAQQAIEGRGKSHDVTFYHLFTTSDD